MRVGLGWFILINTNQGTAETPLFGTWGSSRHSENCRTTDLSIFFQHLRSLRGMVLSWQRKPNKKAALRTSSRPLGTYIRPEACWTKRFVQ